MGSTQSAEFAELVDAGDVSLRSAVEYQLRCNHYPPVPLSMVDPCIFAIEAINEGDPDREINLPDGITWHDEIAAPAYAIADGHHLWDFTERDAF